MIRVIKHRLIARFRGTKSAGNRGQIQCKVLNLKREEKRQTCRRNYVRTNIHVRKNYAMRKHDVSDI